MSTTEAGRIRYLSPPAAVSMGDDWYSIAGLAHFWIRRRFEVLRRLGGGLIREASAIADVGCGHGILQRQIEDHFQKQVTGFDLNELALKQTLSRTSPLCCYNLFQKSSEYRSRFDLICLFDVLEHLPNEDSFIDAIQFHLARNGRILINVPALQSLWSKYDQAAGHFRRYNFNTLSSVAERNGMRVGAWSYWGIPLMPLAVLRKMWLSGTSDANVISAGFDSRGALMNRILLALCRCELTPQHVLGTSLMAVLEESS